MSKKETREILERQGAVEQTNYHDKTWLQERYWGEGLSTRQVACLAGVHRATIGNWMKKHGIPRRSMGGARCGVGHGNWRGGRTMEGEGYIQIWIPDHPYANSRGYVMEHRLVMEEVLGRYLEPQERVHHINEIRHDNRKENLALFPSMVEHLALHKEGGK